MKNLNRCLQRERGSGVSADQPPDHRAADQLARMRQAPSYTSEELFAGTKEVVIWHGKEPYRLRITRNGKLILHK